MGLHRAVAVALVALFSSLGALHVYWAAGGSWGSRVSVPEIDGKPAFRPGRTATLVVALLLATAAAVVSVRANLFVVGSAGSRIAHLGTWTLVAVFVLRAIGDFRRVGFFQGPRRTPFARYDTFLFSPLSLAIALGCLFTALGP
ncbi:MAG TPA: DUF3995 domain-containing protein [Polyangiaceae bacterium]|jgi:hypothetical protein|nr:DUF3995 domain-containing protein [Polyangiaceae bacterium]